MNVSLFQSGYHGLTNVGVCVHVIGEQFYIVIGLQASSSINNLLKESNLFEMGLANR